MTDFVDRVFIKSHKAMAAASNTVGNAYSTLKDSTSEVSGWAVQTIKKNSSRLKTPAPPPPPPESFYERAIEKVKAHKFMAITTGLIGFSAAAYLLQTQYQILGKPRKRSRRANRLGNGARYEVVLIVGSPSSPFIQRLIRDLNTRGFIVYVTTTSEEELKVIENEDSSDVRSLAINYESNKTVKESIKRFYNILISPVLPFPGAANEHYLNLKGVIIAPDWTRLPRVSHFEQLNMMELKRVLDDKCLGIVGILNNGLLDVIRENNERASMVEEVNGILNANGSGTKVLFLDVVPSSSHGNDNGSVQRLALQMNDQLFKLLRDSCFPRSWFSNAWSGLNGSWAVLGLSKLTAKYSFSSKDDVNESKIVPRDSGYSYIMHNVEDFASNLGASWTLAAPAKNKKICSSKLHHKVFDMLCSSKWALFPEETIFI
ncbi:unnamed protein product [Kuraishia capsulata CBS 1993]|uniref:DUF1776-domain-containing protein n=1 Tax=Kuraishia capsulata CBS 1993 TaxID=1382522 RepID=W6MSK7_9ASCO|nr:uncharacterized protein KUCA_T00005784001 [Kuraishia capsulata CBS 1993]CDK29791.1 unnamed protein product [Kuraishia capsulata CBS 1993]